MLDQVKKFRKGQADSIDFLNDDEGGDNGGRKKTGNPAVAAVERRKFKDKKYGFGGKKKGMKANTKDSVNDVSSYSRPRSGKKGGSAGGFKGKGGAGKGGAAKRPGKSRRQNMKG